MYLCTLNEEKYIFRVRSGTPVERLCRRVNKVYKSQDYDYRYEYAKKAYESGDVMRLAGILFLSKRMGHETEYIKQKKEEIRQGKEKELNEAISSVSDTRQYLSYCLQAESLQ